MTNPIISSRSPMQPIATEVDPVINQLAGIRAVIFDVYGTLLISGSGDVGSAGASDRIATADAATEDLVAVAFRELGLEDRNAPTSNELTALIGVINERRRSAECPKPEVEIIEVWRRLLLESGNRHIATDTAKVVRLAATYESLANPTWPMPGAADLIQTLSQSGLRLGIVSNAQVFTIELVESLTESLLSDGPFDLDLCHFSNRYRQSKPGPRMFDALVAALQRAGVRADQAVYVGNDMLNDVWAAGRAGLRTAWFAGDRRSLRRRSDDDRCFELRPDVIVTDLAQLLDCLPHEAFS